MLTISTVLVILFVFWGITLCVWAFLRLRNYQLTRQLYYEEFRAKRALRNIRDTMTMFGFDMSNITDEQLQKGINDLSEKVATYGITAEEFAEHLRRLNAGLPS